MVFKRGQLSEAPGDPSDPGLIGLGYSQRICNFKKPQKYFVDEPGLEAMDSESVGYQVFSFWLSTIQFDSQLGLP